MNATDDVLSIGDAANAEHPGFAIFAIGLDIRVEREGDFVAMLIRMRFATSEAIRATIDHIFAKNGWKMNKVVAAEVHIVAKDKTCATCSGLIEKKAKFVQGKSKAGDESIDVIVRTPSKPIADNVALGELIVSLTTNILDQTVFLLVVPVTPETVATEIAKKDHGFTANTIPQDAMAVLANLVGLTNDRPEG
jgi:hypothetical protein